MRKQISAILALVLTALQITACGKTDGGTETTAAPFDQSTTEISEKREDSLPSGLDFKGTTINILWWEENHEFADEQNGEIVNDALYKRDIAVEERLNVKLNNIAMSYTWATRDVYIGAIRNSVMAGDNQFDIVSGQYATMPSLITDNALINLNKLPYLDFTKPWWANRLVEESSLDGKLYLATGEIAIANIKQLSCIFSNNRLIDEYKLENPYDLVKNGKWTIDKLHELTSGIYSDLNGNDKRDIGDRFGLLIYNNNAIPPFIQSFDLHITTLDSNRYPKITFGNERVVSSVEKICTLLFDNDGVYYDKASVGDQVKGSFKDGNGVFTAGLFNDASTIYNAMTDNYGVLPYPKYNEAQENYYSAVNEGNTLFGITATSPNLDASAAVMEALAAENHYTVSPAYYEIALKVKYARDDESAQMFDLIRNGVMFEFGSIYISIGIKFNIKSQVSDNNRNWASHYAENEEASKAAIDSFYGKIKNLD